MKLSILICHLYNRQESLAKLLDVLRPQITDDSNVEILIKSDDGTLTTGVKRNRLLKQAVGDYVAFVDDDDLVSNDYVSKILKAVETNPDCCSLQGEISMTERGKRVEKIFIHSLKYDHWFEENQIYYRCPNHLNAIRRDIALKVGFPNKNHGEDSIFSMKAYPVLNTEEYIEGTIYYYFAS